MGYFNQGRWLTYPLQVETAGRYKVTLRAANGHGAPLNNFLGVQVNGSRQNVSVNIPVTGTEESFNQWHTYVELDPFYITLPAGEATLRLECQVGEGPNLDYMTIERTDEPEPEDPLLQKLSAEHPVQILAKDYKDKDTSVGTETNDGKVSIAWWQENRWIEYLLEVPEAGTYSLTLNGANGHGAPVTDFVKVEVNGAEQPVDITASDAGQDNWFGFRDLAPCQISLPAGRVTLRLTHTKGAFESFNLYSLSLEKLPDEAVGLQYISDEQPTLVEAEACADAAEGLIWEQNNTSAGQFLDGRWLDYQLYVPTAGAYSLTLLAAHNLDHTVTDFLEVTVGDGQPMAIAGSLPAAGGWYAFQDFGPFPLELPAGTVTLRLKNTSSDGVNLDGFRLEKQPDAQTAGAAKTALAAASAPAAAQRDGKIMLADVYRDPSRMEAFIGQLTDEELIYLSGGHYALGNSSCESFGDLPAYGIPPAATADGPAGLRLDSYMKITAFPCESLLACTWNTDLLYRVAAAMGEECIRANTDLLLTPGLNIHRNPLCGRNFEYFSEDPLLTGKLGAAYVQGLQSKNVGAVVKHFAMNEKEDNRRGSDSRASERAIREIYLRCFQITIEESNPWAVMSSYNLINGTKAAESVDLLTNILRGEWEYDGLVMSDWDNEDINFLAAIAGDNLKMPKCDAENLRFALAHSENSGLTRDILERNVRYILEAVMKTNIFLTQYANPVPCEIGSDDTLYAARMIRDKSSYIRTIQGQDIGMGLVLGYCEAEEWTEYDISVEQAGSYQLSARISSPAGMGAFTLLLDGQPLASFANQQSTGSWEEFLTLTGETVDLPAGGQDPDAWELHIGDLDRNQSISISDVMKLCRILASK